MKRISLVGALLISISSFAQEAIIVNGGQYGNSSEDANVLIYDHTNNQYRSIDTIHTQSVQEVILDGFWAYVAAQDSIVKYNLSSGSRVAAARFHGPSTKSLALTNGLLLVGNWYGKSSHNLYLYDSGSLNLIDSIAAVDKGTKSILIKNGVAYITQNRQNGNYQDTLGSILRFDIASRTITDTITVNGYTGDFGELIENASGTGFYAFNSTWNTITTVDYSTLSATNTNFPLDLNISSRSHYSRRADTLFARFGNGIGAIDLSNLAILDSSIIDTVVTAFSYDSLNNLFFLTQTNFFSYNYGKIYGRSGNLLAPFNVGFSPEVIRMHYGGTLGLDGAFVQQLDFEFYPNPANELLNIRMDEAGILRVFNMNGSLVLEERLNTGRSKLDIHSFPQGAYMVRIESNGSVGSKILIVQ